MQRRTVLTGLVAAVAATSLVPSNRAMAGRVHQIEIRDFAFVPTRLKVAPGDEVTWINRDVVPHTATASDESWDTGSLDQGQSTTLTIAEGMQARYFCRFHPSMVAELVIG